MTGIQFVTDDKGRRVAVQIDLRKHGAAWEDFWDGLVAESRRKEKTTFYASYRAKRLKRQPTRG
jgi:predicted phage tail protein